MSSNSLPRTDHPRRVNGTLRPILSKESPGHSQSISAGLAARSVLFFAADSVQSLLFILFRVLARRVRCWFGLGAHETEQEKVDRSRGSAIGMA